MASKLDRLKQSVGGNAAESMSSADGRAQAGPPAKGPAARPAHLQGVTKSNDVAEIEVGRIAADPEQPRKEFDPDRIAEMAASLKESGQLQPIRVRWDPATASYVIISGERRWRGAKMAGLAKLLCVIDRRELEDSALVVDQLVENLQRVDLRPIEQATKMQDLIIKHGLTQVEVARRLGVERSKVVKALALLDLPEDVREKVEDGRLAPATAYELTKLADEEDRREVAEKVVGGDLNRADAIEEVKKVAARKPKSGKGGGGKAGGKAKKETDRAFNARGIQWRAVSARGFDASGLLASAREIVERLEVEVSPSPGGVAEAATV